jgi:hypothetical protein
MPENRLRFNQALAVAAYTYDFRTGGQLLRASQSQLRTRTLGFVDQLYPFLTYLMRGSASISSRNSCTAPRVRKTTLHPGDAGSLEIIHQYHSVSPGTLLEVTMIERNLPRTIPCRVQRQACFRPIHITVPFRSKKLSTTLWS